MNNKNKLLNRINVMYILEKLVYLLSYTIVFLMLSYFFDSFVIDREHLFVYAFVSVTIVYTLNKTIKPILVRFTIPITGLTMGIAYFFNNVIILKLVDFLMGFRLEFKSLFVLFFIAILMSFSNLLIEEILVKPVLKGVKKHE